MENIKTYCPTPDTPLPTPLSSLLIANRGEIASRIIRTCKQMGIRSVAVYSEADRNAKFVREADFSVFIGESAPTASYLHQEKLIDICKQHQIEAIHPGYGFLSENAEFAQKCQEAGVIFIGPSPEAIAAMGSKAEAKNMMQAQGVPTVPGYHGEDQSLETLRQAAQKIGFPVLLKAASGGGGKGMRIVQSEKDLKNAIEAAQREAQNAFGSGRLIIEKYIASGRHVEFQIFGDKHGNLRHLFERECSLQRRYQKVMEESPSPVLSDELRAKMGEAALKAASALNYENAGTVEFILDDKTQEFYFLEVNTRLQVEHPVTEEITGLDLVQLQIEVAEGQPLTFTQEEIKAKGYALECRLYAEDPAQDFMPATGKILHWQVPKVEGLRLETAVESGGEISIYYDPMIAKLIVWDKNRLAAHRKMLYVLKNLLCLGITTNQDFLIKLLENQRFRQGDYNTQFLQNDFDFQQIQPTAQAKQLAGIAATLYDWHCREQQRTLLKHLPSGWRNSFYQHQQEKYLIGEEELLVKYRYLSKQHFEFIVGESAYKVELLEVGENTLSFEVEGQRYQYYLAKSANDYFLRNENLGGLKLQLQARFPEKESEKVKGAYIAPMPSQVVKVLVETGQSIEAGTPLVVLSSMKMENTIAAEEEGKVEDIYVQNGQNVEADTLLLRIN